jgi:membrane-bound serine protease (ClpP class)
MHKLKLLILIPLFYFFTFFIPGQLTYADEITEREVFIVDIKSGIFSGAVGYISNALKEAEERHFSLIIIRLDTPGGGVPQMKDIVKLILNSPIPVVVYVSPSGAGAASAGVFITIAAHIAAMAPGTNIGAAHPVTVGGKDIEKTVGKDMSEKALNDLLSFARGITKQRNKNWEWVEKAILESVSITAEEALKNNVIDVIAKDLDELLEKIDGKEVDLPTGKVKINTEKLKKVFYEPKFKDKILNILSHPEIIALLFLIGIAGIYFEISHPGVIFPGVIGAISLILALYASQALPVNYAGFLLMLLGVILFIAELKVTSYGILSIGGLVSFTLGSIIMFRGIGVSYFFIISSSVVIGLFFIFVAGLAFRAYRTKPKGGSEGLIGEMGKVSEDIDPEGRVFVHGEYWNALADEKIETGEKVEVIGMEGLVLKVKKI